MQGQGAPSSSHGPKETHSGQSASQVHGTAALKPEGTQPQECGTAVVTGLGTNAGHERHVHAHGKRKSSSSPGICDDCY